MNEEDWNALRSIQDENYNSRCCESKKDPPVFLAKDTTQLVTNLSLAKFPMKHQVCHHATFFLLDQARANAWIVQVLGAQKKEHPRVWDGRKKRQKIENKRWKGDIKIEQQTVVKKDLPRLFLW